MTPVEEIANLKEIIDNQIKIKALEREITKRLMAIIKNTVNAN